MKIIQKYNETNLILRIVIGLIVGTVLGLIWKHLDFITLMGTLFKGSLQSLAPILVFVLIVTSLSNSASKMDRRFGRVIFLYMLSTFLAAFAAVVVSYVFPQTVVLTGKVAEQDAPGGIREVLTNLLNSIVQNPVNALAEGSYISILFWAVLLGMALKKVDSDAAKQMFKDLSEGVSTIVRWIINLAPFGVMGLVYGTVSSSGLSVFGTYGKLLVTLVGCMLLVALVIDPLVSFVCMRRNPYPLVWRCLKESGLMAFFTRSSAANIPVNMDLCKRLGLDEEMYSVSIPLGATINMDGAAITITIMTLATANTVGVQVDFATAVILSILATLGACGASGVAGGSLLLIPMACSLFGIDASVAMQTVGIGFIISVVQDSVETALNSSGDVMFAATAEYTQWIKDGHPESLPTFLGGQQKMDV
ncbi:serine/threonine transporter SstT [Catenisphaera adipataccumulans]|jgi:Na+/serine symporter|uniref:Serine/threonine transporter SstT n=1 Tax=Catenisphaera adipataccumulans TaxID=700500 RepID=A0A7W8FUV2_9FIRM|nr:serine/threonine transporter SstT [Catenisphaera adipataccumulans]MBB5182483.1 serine/threonine transporter [Catenisphaera adipataccumulans]